MVKHSVFFLFQIPLSPEVQLRNCMIFTSHSSPNLTTHLFFHQHHKSHYPISLLLNHFTDIKIINNSLSYLLLILPSGPKRERTSSRKCAKYQRSLCPRIYGHGGNTAKNPSRALHIRGGTTDAAAQRVVWPGNKWSGTDPTRECS